MFWENKNIDIWKINVQEKLNEFSASDEGIDKAIELEESGKKKEFLYIVTHTAENLIHDSKYKNNFNHTFRNFPVNFWYNKNWEVLLYDGWVLWEWKEVLKAIWDEMYEVLNNKKKVENILDS